jgi:hypothetical protein
MYSQMAAQDLDRDEKQLLHPRPIANPQVAVLGPIHCSRRWSPIDIADKLPALRFQPKSRGLAI